MSAREKLSELADNLNHWRKNVKKHRADKIPEEFLSIAASLAKELKPGPVAKKLGLSSAQMRAICSNNAAASSSTSAAAMEICFKFSKPGHFEFSCEANHCAAIPAIAELIARLEGGIELV